MFSGEQYLHETKGLTPQLLLKFICNIKCVSLSDLSDLETNSSWCSKNLGWSGVKQQQNKLVTEVMFSIHSPPFHISPQTLALITWSVASTQKISQARGGDITVRCPSVLDVCLCNPARKLPACLRSVCEAAVVIFLNCRICWFLGSHWGSVKDFACGFSSLSTETTGRTAWQERHQSGSHSLPALNGWCGLAHVIHFSVSQLENVWGGWALRQPGLSL